MAFYEVPFMTTLRERFPAAEVDLQLCPPLQKYACSVVTTYGGHWVWSHSRKVVLNPKKRFLTRMAVRIPFKTIALTKIGGMHSYIDILSSPFDCQNLCKWLMPPLALQRGLRSGIRSLVNSSSCTAFTISLVGFGMQMNLGFHCAQGQHMYLPCKIKKNMSTA